MRCTASRSRSASDNCFRLLVAIADVSHYVKPNDALDVDALERSTSVYFPRRVIPMLPEKLSNGLCSLNPAVDRLTLVCDMVVSSIGEVTAYQFYPAVIHSAARLTYNEVADILGNTAGPEAARRPAIVPHLLNLNDVYHALNKARQVRGAIDFETTETYIVCNALGKIEKIIPRTRNDAHKLIEECMLAANVCAADLLIRHKHPGTYRIHASPTEEKLTQVRTFLKQVGLNLAGGDKPSANDYAVLMKQVKERPDAQLLQTMLLRSMQQAVYSPDNIGHFGLAYEAYAHFTSPIRRYPDLLTHRAIKAILLGKKYEPKGIDLAGLNTTVSNATRKKQAKDKAQGTQKQEKDLTIWDALGVHCSANERRADEASRDVEAWLKCYFIKDKLGEEFTGVVSGVTTFGIFVQLDALYVEGLVHITELGTDFFQYDDARHELRGERTGKRYQLTDRVTVQVARVDLEARKIDLVLAGGAADQVSGAGLPKSSAAKALEAKPAKSRKPSANTASRYELDTSVDNGAPAKRQQERCGCRQGAIPFSKTSNQDQQEEAITMKNKMIFGFHAVTSRLRHEASSVEEIFVDAGRQDGRMHDLIAAAKAVGVRVMPVDSARLDKIVGTRRHQGVIAFASQLSLARNLDELLDAIEGPPLLLILDGITDPHNLGACLRVADGVGAHAVIVPKDRAVGLNATAAKVASGAAETVPYITVTNLARTMRELKERDILLIGTTDDADKGLYEADFTGPAALVMGSEGEGMRRLTRETCDVLVGIPMFGSVESLNVSVASGVCLYEARRQRMAREA